MIKYIRRRKYTEGVWKGSGVNYSLFYAQNEAHNITDRTVYCNVANCIARINEYCWETMDWYRYGKFV